MTATTAVVLAMAALVMGTVARVVTAQALVMATVVRVVTAQALVTVTVVRVVTAQALATAVVLVTVTAVRVIGNSISDAGVQVIRNAILGSASMGRGYLVASSGNVTDEVWKDSINKPTPEATGICRWRIHDVSPELTD
ncbi:MAG: hypothetical protein ABF290_11275 [Thiogranum sp.]